MLTTYVAITHCSPEKCMQAILVTYVGSIQWSLRAEMLGMEVCTSTHCCMRCNPVMRGLLWC